MIDHIFHNKELLSIIIRSNYEQNGIKFFTPNDFSQQLGYMKREKGYVIDPHIHRPVNREVHFTKEVLFIKTGKVRVDFYDDLQNYLESRILLKGDVILLAKGGHGFTMLDKSEIIEVKQGPYLGDEDKSRFKPLADNKIKIIK